MLTRSENPGDMKVWQGFLVASRQLAGCLTSGLIADPQHFAEIAADALFRTNRHAAFPPCECFIDKFGVRHRRVPGLPGDDSGFRIGACVWARNKLD